MAKKRNPGRSGGGSRSQGPGGGRTAETAMMARFRGWYRAHLAQSGADHEHLDVEETVEVLTDLFAMTRDLRPRGTFATPDAELLDRIFDTIESDLDGDDGGADLDDTLFTVAEVIEHYLDFLVDTDQWQGSDEDLDECQAVLDEVLDLAGSFIDAVLDDLAGIDPVPAQTQLAAVRGTVLVRAAEAVLERLAARPDETLTEQAARELVAEHGIVSAGSEPSDDTVRIPVSAWWVAMTRSGLLVEEDGAALLGDAAVTWRTGEPAALVAERVAYIARFLALWLLEAQRSAALTDTEHGAFAPLERAIATTDAVLVRMAVACQADIHPGLVVGELVDELAADEDVELEDAIDERERIVGSAERMLDDAADLGLLVHSPEFGYVTPEGMAPVIAAVVRATAVVLAEQGRSTLQIDDGDEEGEVAEALTLLVSLQGTDPEVERRLELAADATLRDLHLALQLALGWTDAQPHYFRLGSAEEEDAPIGSPADAEELGEGVVDESTVTLAEAFTEPGDELSYVYDLDDEWRHTIRLEQAGPAGAALPRCTGARGAAPVDAPGGPAGWADTVRAATDPASPDHDDALELLGVAEGGRFDPDAVDLEAINRSLGLLRAS